MALHHCTRSRTTAPDVVITGIGLISCLGLTPGAVVEALRSGRSGIVADEQRRGRFRSTLTGQIEDFEPARHGINRKLARTMAQPAMFAYAAAIQAIAQAQLTPDHLHDRRCGVVFGNDSSVVPVAEALDAVRTEGSTHMIGAGNVFRAMNSTVTMNLASALGTGGAGWTLSAACASGAHALGQAMMLIRAGLQDRVLAGGAQELNWQSVTSFDALGVFSAREDAPAEACRPFDHRRDGLVPSGGAACLVLEREDLAHARHAPILAYLRGYGFNTALGESMSQPSAAGAHDAMAMALDDAAVAPAAVDYVNAHATGTPLGDAVEAHAIHRVFGDRTPVSSTKSITGHECWMCGASEVAYTILMAHAGFIAGNRNFERLDDQCAPIAVVPQTRPAVIRTAVSNSFGFGGTNACLVLQLSPSPTPFTP